MDPEGSLPHSQVPATCPYSESALSNPYPHILLPEDREVPIFSLIFLKIPLRDKWPQLPLSIMYGCLDSFTM